jgi:general secretion pathway protein K
MALLIDDKKDTNIDSVQETWADPETIAATLKTLVFENGRLNYVIEDERGRIQINALVQYPQGKQFNQRQTLLWLRFLAGFKSAETLFADVEPITIINSLKDWLDFGDDDAITGLTGAESDYYEALDPPYSCRNGPIQHISELTLIRGMSPALFTGLENQLGLSHYLTIHGMSRQGSRFTFNGKINLNTAPEPVIKALLPEELANLAKAIVDYRVEKSDGQFVNNISNPMWYKKVPGVGDVTIHSSLITPVSDLFRIRAAAVIGHHQKGASVIIRRKKESESGKWYCQVIRMENDPAAIALLQQGAATDE